MPPTGVVPLPLPTKHSKQKRTRTAYSQQQEDILEIAFHVNPYPNIYNCREVAFESGLPEDRVQVYTFLYLMYTTQLHAC